MSDPDLRVVRSGPSRAERLLVLLPGYGDAVDVFTRRVERLDPDGRWAVAVVEPRLGTPHGPAWFTVDDAGPDPAQLDASADAVADAFAHLLDHVGADPTRSVLAGFSQGGALALAVLCDPASPAAPGAVGVLAGYLPHRDDDRLDLARAAGRPVLVAHGADDEMVDPLRGRAAGRALARAGAEVTALDVEGGHRLAEPLLAPFASWLAERAGDG